MRGLGVQLFAISPDRPAELKATMEEHALPFQLLSDSQMTAPRAFGIAYRVDAAMLEQLAKHGIDLEEASGQTHHELPVPAVFLVATSGVIQFQYVNPDYTVRPCGFRKV